MKHGILKIAGPYDDIKLDEIKSGFEKIIGEPLDFKVEQDKTLIGGFAAYIDGKVYDQSVFVQIDDLMEKHFYPKKDDLKSVGDFLREKIKNYKYTTKVYGYGVVTSCTDDVIHIDGLSGSRYGEVLEFNNGTEYGLALDLGETTIGAVCLSKNVNIIPGTIVKGTGTVASVCADDILLGRVIDPIGRPLDGKELNVSSENLRHIEGPAPSIMQRSPVDKPLETGILAIDSMIPIGRGQRELIIGDRQTGKTAIALSTIINQKKDDVICIYCAVGQKASTIAQVVYKLKQANAFDNTIVVATTADDCVAMQYLTPYAGCAIAEKFMYEGKDVLIVYDDLSKHAAAYRSMSLLLRRPSGREAYPGDVFYLHSRLLERSAKLSDKMGGGSITALPIIETMSGDISAYIPTNVISITDGQIYLESELFNAGIRPAVNVGLSVSRVGRSAQHSAMRKVSSSLRLELAQYRDTAVFAQFGADIDESTSNLLHRGEQLTQLLKQNQNITFSLAEQVMVLLAYTNNLLKYTKTVDIITVKDKMLDYVRKSASGTVHAINTSGELTDSDKTILLSSLKDFFGVK